MRLPPELYDYLIPFLSPSEVFGTQWRTKSIASWAGVCRAFRDSIRSYISPHIILDGRKTAKEKEELGNHMLSAGDTGKELRHLHRLLCITSDEMAEEEARRFRLIDPTLTTRFEVIDEVCRHLSPEDWFESYWEGSDGFWYNLENLFDGEDEASAFQEEGGWILEKANDMVLDCMTEMDNLVHVTWATGLAFLLEKAISLPDDPTGDFAVSYDLIPQTKSIATLLSKRKNLSSITFKNKAVCDIRPLSYFTTLRELHLDTNMIVDGLEGDDERHSDDASTFMKRIFKSNKNLTHFSIFKLDRIWHDSSCLPYWAVLDVQVGIDPDDDEERASEPVIVDNVKALTSLRGALFDLQRTKGGNQAKLVASDITHLFKQDDLWSTYRAWCDDDPKLAEEVALVFNERSEIADNALKKTDTPQGGQFAFQL